MWNSKDQKTKTTCDQKHGTPPIGTSSVLSCHPKAPAFSCAWLGSDLYHVVPDAELPCDYLNCGTVGLFYSAIWQNNANKNPCPWSFEVTPRKIWTQESVETQGPHLAYHHLPAPNDGIIWNLWTSRPAPAFVHPEWALCLCKCTNSRPPGSHKTEKQRYFVSKQELGRLGLLWLVACQPINVIWCCQAQKQVCRFEHTMILSYNKANSYTPTTSASHWFSLIIRVTCATVFLCFSASSFICSKHATVWRSLSCSVQGLPQWGVC